MVSSPYVLHTASWTSAKLFADVFPTTVPRLHYFVCLSSRCDWSPCYAYPIPSTLCASIFSISLKHIENRVHPADFVLYILKHAENQLTKPFTLPLFQSNRLSALPSLLSHVPTPVHHFRRPYSAQLPRPTADYVLAQNSADASNELRDKHRSWHAGPQFAPRDHEQSDSRAIREDFFGASEPLHKEEEKTLVELVWSGGSVPAHSARSPCSSAHSTRSSGDISVDPRQLSSAVRSQIDDFFTPKETSYVKHEQESPSDHATPTELQTVIENQIFLGLISMQYQVNASVLETIRRLSQACIRFVHFSRENELRSRVFAERLGLECEWNCHISLASPGHANPSNSAAGHNSRVRDECLYSVSQLKEPFIHGSTASFHHTPGPVKKVALERSGSVPHALPSTINKSRTLIHSPSAMTVVPRAGTVGTKRSFDGYFSFGSPSPLDISLLHMRSDGSNMSQNDTNNNGRNTVSLHSDGSSTSSDTISSTSVEDETHNRERNDALRLSDYLTQNKSRLPCGIENIRPHLMHVDNVPLQVSLFTDCTPDTAYQMITILQEYGEIVCTVGSCLSVDNIQPLARGDVALLMLPILPQPCTIFKDNPSDDPPSVSSPLCSEPSFRRRPRKWYKRFSHRSHPIDSETIALETRKSQLRECITPIDSVELTSRIVSLLFPWVLDMQTHGFRIYPLVHEVRASVNNLYLLLTFSVLAPLSAALLQWLLLLVGLPSLPLITSPSSFVAHSSSSASTPDRVTVLWLPSQRLRMHLLPISDKELQQHSLVNLEEAVRLNHELAQSGFTAGQLLWLILFVVPALSLSLLDRQIERTRPLREPPTKRGTPVNLKKCIRTVVITALRFLPSVLVCAVCELSYFLFAPGFDSCNRIIVSSDNWTQSSETGVPLSNLSLASVPQCVIQLSVLTALVKDVVFFQLILCLVATSFVFANYGQHICKFRWSSNPSWCVSVFLIVTIRSTATIQNKVVGSLASYYGPQNGLHIEIVALFMSVCQLEVGESHVECIHVLNRFVSPYIKTSVRNSGFGNLGILRGVNHPKFSVRVSPKNYGLLVSLSHGYD
ncbi:hypothetical protein CLF_112133 [Clonorchis sinensis]|uniref:Uncharacterized protein n=1 Tax=Clonorchis sinensis TaxID=79923 RepID=G7YMA3_CLOSI|nr:hypothetical protein CLF_112133 [Clonorchis sinensis]